MLTWDDGRWHLRGQGIHAGAVMEVRWPDGKWEKVRIESADAGRRLYAHFKYHGVDLCVLVVVEDGYRDPFQLRWA